MTILVLYGHYRRTRKILVRRISRLPTNRVSFPGKESTQPREFTQRRTKCVPDIKGARGGADGLGTALQAGRSRVRFPMASLEFFINIILDQHRGLVVRASDY